MLTKLEAQKRNFKIMQLRGILPRFMSLIPPDIKSRMKKRDLYILETIAKDLMKEIDSVKVKRFVCLQCATKEETRETKNKKAWKCDCCGVWGVPLYLTKRKDQ